MEKLTFKFLGKKHIDKIYELTSEVYEGIENKEIFSHDSKSDLEHIIDNGGAFIGVYDGDKLVAYRSIKVPNDEENLAYDVDFYLDPKKVIINDTVAVLKEYRGKNLQNITREKLEEKYKDSNFTHKMSTVSPKNYHSYKNTLDSGYMLVALKKKYPDELCEEGYDRFILLKSEDIDFDFTGEEVIINASEIDKLKEIFASNYFGVSVDDKGNILFKKVKPFDRFIAENE
ncbi:GNAT family N-acetyltransferase [Peptoniphilus sp. AGMB00490]|uniref:GNAT family N-acetyltransferase n=1 Tax=Peptoniphilus faecalis TaxID=2731255 RepID=A0A848RKH4_9FIRM|nr:GNAT family N-acetyltransferase [Peptoniphilus faecalis]NMW84832.1 GNAT family N-acetyltransferase [Peptoniphilus faecalis]